jgi:hypothetical protein
MCLPISGPCALLLIDLYYKIDLLSWHASKAIGCGIITIDPGGLAHEHVGDAGLGGDHDRAVAEVIDACPQIAPPVAPAFASVPIVGVLLRLDIGGIARRASIWAGSGSLA